MNIAPYIEHTLLKPEATFSDIEKICLEAKENQFAGVCISPVYVEHARNILSQTKIKCVSVVGFPSGSFLSQTKADEAAHLAQLGADELDMVMAIWALKSKKYELVQKDIEAVVQAAKNEKPGVLVKVIIETALLSDEEKTMATQLAINAGANFIKTSTGQFGGATLEDVMLIQQAAKGKAQIKASGGIKDQNFAQKLIEAGATRLGTSSGISLTKGVSKTSLNY